MQAEIQDTLLEPNQLKEILDAKKLDEAMKFIEDTLINTVSVFEEQAMKALNSEPMKLYRYVSLLYFYRHKYLKDRVSNYTDDSQKKITRKLSEEEKKRIVGDQENRAFVKAFYRELSELQKQGKLCVFDEEVKTSLLDNFKEILEKEEIELAQIEVEEKEEKKEEEKKEEDNRI